MDDPIDIREYGVRGLSCRLEDKIIEVIDLEEFKRMTVAEVLGTLDIVHTRLTRLL